MDELEASLIKKLAKLQVHKTELEAAVTKLKGELEVALLLSVLEELDK